MDRRNFLKVGITTGITGAIISSPIKLFGDVGLPPENDLLIAEGGTIIGRYQTGINSLGGIGRFVKKGQKVVVKPSMAFDRTPDFGLTTNPLLIREIIVACYKAGARVVSVFDHTRDPWTKSYKNSGIERIAKDVSARVLPANHEMYYSEVKSDKAKILKSVKINKTLLEADVLINVPVVSFNKDGRIDAAMANLIGCTWDFNPFDNDGFDQSLPELLYFIKPALNIIDVAVVRSQAGNREPVKPGLIIFSTDCVAADSIACQLAGVNPGENKYIENAGKLGFGNPVASYAEVKRISSKI